MQNNNNLRAYLQSENPRKGAKTFSVKGIESKLNLPAKTLDNFINYGRGLGDFEKTVQDFFTRLGYNENINYDNFL